MENDQAKPQYVDVADFLAAPENTVKVFLRSEYSPGNYVTITQDEHSNDTVTPEEPSSEILAPLAQALCEALPTGVKAIASYEPAGGNKENVGRSEVTLWISSGDRVSLGNNSLIQATLVVNIMAEALDE